MFNTKKIGVIVLALITACSVIVFGGQGEVFDEEKKECTFIIDGVVIETDQPPVMQVINRRCYVPLRALLENIGYTVDWDDETKSVIFSKGDDIFIYTPIEISASPSGVIYKNGNEEPIVAGAYVMMNWRVMVNNYDWTLGTLQIELGIRISLDWENHVVTVTSK